jgi:hypothetical protein
MALIAITSCRHPDATAIPRRVPLNLNDPDHLYWMVPGRYELGLLLRTFGERFGVDLRIGSPAPASGDASIEVLSHDLPITLRRALWLVQRQLPEGTHWVEFVDGFQLVTSADPRAAVDAAPEPEGVAVLGIYGTDASAKDLVRRGGELLRRAGIASYGVTNLGGTIVFVRPKDAERARSTLSRDPEFVKYMRPEDRPGDAPGTPR